MPRCPSRGLILETINVDEDTRLKVRVVRRSSAISSHRSLLARSYSIVALVTFNCFDRIEHRVYAGLAFNLPSCLCTSCIVYRFVLGHRYTQELVELSGYCFFFHPFSIDVGDVDRILGVFYTGCSGKCDTALL